MVNKKEPSFFDCGCDEHYSVEITDSMRSKAFSEDNGDILDTKDSRSEERSSSDADIGFLAEIVAKEFLESVGHDVEFSDDWKYDLIVDGELRVDVKCRDYTQTAPEYSDLLFRDRQDTELNEDDFDYVLQVMLNGVNSSEGFITGYCSSDVALNADRFWRAKTHRTRKVEHSDLTMLDESGL